MTFSELIESLRGKDRVPDGLRLPAPTVVIPSAEGYVASIEGVAEAAPEDLMDSDDDVDPELDAILASG